MTDAAANRKNYINGHRRRTCICDDPRCAHMSLMYSIVGDTKLCTYIRVPKHTDTKTERGEVVRHIRRRICRKLGVEDPKDESVDQEWIWAGHFHRDLLKENNEGTRQVLSSKEYSSLNDEIKGVFSSKTDKLKVGKGKYMVLPTMSRSQMRERFLEDCNGWDKNIPGEINTLFLGI